MTETLPNSAQTQTASAPTPERFAGKYADDPAAHKGVNEIRKSLGLDELAADRPLYGEKGHFPDRPSAERAYKELEKVYHSTRRSAPTNAPTELPIQNTKNEEVDEPPETVLERAGITLADAAKALDSGSLTPEQIAKIRQTTPGYKNLSDAKINLIAKGHYAEIQQKNAKQSAVYQEVSQKLGGEERHTTLREWAKTGVDQSVLDEWAAIVKKNPSMYLSMMNDIAARHAEKIGASNSKPLINGGGGAPGMGMPTTRAEFQALYEKANNGNLEANRILSRMSIEQINAFA